MVISWPVAARRKQDGVAALYVFDRAHITCDPDASASTGLTRSPDDAEEGHYPYGVRGLAELRSRSYEKVPHRREGEAGRVVVG
jgi:hypothetical protein